MKKVSSIVWRFFERLEENGRCIAVVCKLCESEYKYFGNTTNLRVHLINKHPIQWELSNSGLDDNTTLVEGSSTPNSSVKKRKYRPRATNVAVDKNVGYSIAIDDHEEASSGAIPRISIQRIADNSDSDDEETINLVRQMHGDQNSGEEWLEDDPYQVTHFETYEPKPKKHKFKAKKIKREIPSPTDFKEYFVTPTSKQERKVIEKDEYSVFGEYIANKLRKIKTPRTRGNIQQMITTILWQAEYGMYDQADTVKRVLMLTLQGPQDFNQDSENNVTEQAVTETEQNDASQSIEDLEIS